MPEKLPQPRAVDPFLEPWSLEDCRDIDVDIDVAYAIRDILRSDATPEIQYGMIYGLSRYENNQQTHIHIMDTLIRLKHVAVLSDKLIESIVVRVHSSGK